MFSKPQAPPKHVMKYHLQERNVFDTPVICKMAVVHEFQLRHIDVIVLEGEHDAGIRAVFKEFRPEWPSDEIQITVCNYFSLLYVSCLRV
jgi:hypothetical protein